MTAAPPIPALPTNTRADLLSRVIARLPTVVQFRGRKITVRLTQPSLKRQTELAGYIDQTANYECLMRLNPGEQKPQAETESIIIGQDTYRIVLVLLDLGDDCYTCTLTKHNK